MSYIDIHTHREGRTVILCGGRELLCRGIHPWRAGEPVESYSLHGIAAIGEIGLDYAANTDRGLQRELFVWQLSLAGQHSLPVIVHCVRAMDDTLSLLSGCNLPAVVFHGFIGNPQVAKGAIERGYCLSFGPTAFRSPKTLETLRTTPRTQLFLETDASGEDIGAVYGRAAEVTGCSVDALEREIYANCKRIFG